MGVIDIARTSVETADAATPVADAVRRLHERSVSGLVVIEDGSPAGLVTHRDLTVALLEDGFDAEATSVGGFVDETTPMVPADSGIYEAIETLSERGARRAIVVDDGDLAGLLSISDVVVLLGMELQQVATAIRSSSPAYERQGPEFLLE